MNILRNHFLHWKHGRFYIEDHEGEGTVIWKWQATLSWERQGWMEYGTCRYKLILWFFRLWIFVLKIYLESLQPYLLLIGFTSLDTFAQSLVLSMINPPFCAQLDFFMLFWKQATVQAAEDLAGGGLGCCLPSPKWIDLSDMRNCGHEWSVAVDAGGAKMLVAAAIRQGLPGIWCLSVDCLPCTKSDKSLGLNFCASCECACGSRWLGPDNALSYAKYAIPKS